MSIKISVIIPTYKRNSYLYKAIESLQKQVFKEFEIIVVDNACENELKNRIEELNQNLHIPTCYVGEPNLGLQHARHAGVRNSNGDILVFTDDDATFDPNWLDAYHIKFKEFPQMAVSGGPVLPKWEKEPPKWLVDFIGNKTQFPILSLLKKQEEFSCSTENYFFGVNMAFRKTVFDWTGFRPELVGSRTIGNGESGLNIELKDKGKLIGFVPEAIAYHYIPGERMTIDYINKWASHLGGADMFSRLNGKNACKSLLCMEAIKTIVRNSPYFLLSLLMKKSTNKPAITSQFRKSLMFYELQYLWWADRDPIVIDALQQKDFKP
jgi:glycosyltransferase involved in cell wall biosynthesis